ncbi:MAG TPA: DUF6232 family protein [Micromonosporaceae bacterium]|nr:DUF6232 family protein [Micromonosporaceae bacterium]
MQLLPVESIEVRISKRVLWVGESAYPLPNVTHVRTVEYKVQRWRVVKQFVRKGGARLALGLLALLVLSCASAPTTLLVLVGLGVLAVNGFQVYWLVQRLTWPPLHVLRVQMAGMSRAAVVSLDKSKIDELRLRVVTAIDNPAVEYTVWIENVNGDVIGGDVVSGDKLEHGDKTSHKTVYESK